MKLQRHHLEQHGRVDWRRQPKVLRRWHKLLQVLLIQVLQVRAYVLEQLMLARQFYVALQVVDDLCEVVAEALVVDAARYGSPAKVVVILLLVAEVEPDLRSQWAAFCEDALDQLRVVSRQNLKFVVKVLPVRTGHYLAADLQLRHLAWECEANFTAQRFLIRETGARTRQVHLVLHGHVLIVPRNLVGRQACFLGFGLGATATVRRRHLHELVDFCVLALAVPIQVLTLVVVVFGWRFR